MKKVSLKNALLVLVITTVGLCGLHAQEEGKFRAGLDLGFAATPRGGGILMDLEPKYNIEDNMNVGLKIALVGVAQKVGNHKTKASAIGSVLGTYDYYFNDGSTSFAPFIGAGLGYYQLSNAKFEGKNLKKSGTASVSGKFGGMLRGGFEFGKFRLGLEYNFIPKTKVKNAVLDFTGDASPTVNTGNSVIKNSYFGVSLGFYLGGGKWGKQTKKTPQ